MKKLTNEERLKKQATELRELKKEKKELLLRIENLEATLYKKSEITLRQIDIINKYQIAKRTLIRDIQDGKLKFILREKSHVKMYKESDVKDYIAKYNRQKPLKENYNTDRNKTSNKIISPIQRLNYQLVQNEQNNKKRKP